MRGAGRLQPGEPGTQGSAEERCLSCRLPGVGALQEDGKEHVIPDMVLVAVLRFGSDLAGAKGT